VCGTGFWRRGEDVVTGGIACLDEGAVDERLVMGCGPPSSWRKFQGTLKRGSSPSHVRPLPPRTPGHHASSLLNFTPQRLRLRIKEGTHPTSPPLLQRREGARHWLSRSLQHILQMPLAMLRRARLQPPAWGLADQRAPVSSATTHVKPTASTRFTCH
jgi:hypothetical protein